jgi:hypothetical protein
MNATLPIQMGTDRVFVGDERTDKLNAEAVQLLNEAGWPVGHFERIESAGDSLEAQDTYLWVTPGGQPMRSFVGRVEVKVSATSSTLKTVILDTIEGW